MKHGFTIIELLLVVGITLLIAATAAPIYGNLQVSSQLDENTNQVVQSIRIARERSVSGLNNSRHGVRLESDKYILYQGSSYALRDSSYDREVVLSDALLIFSTLTNSEVNFSKGAGIPNNTGTTTLRHRLGDERQIIINIFGLIEQE